MKSTQTQMITESTMPYIKVEPQLHQVCSSAHQARNGRVALAQKYKKVVRNEGSKQTTKIGGERNNKAHTASAVSRMQTFYKSIIEFEELRERLGAHSMTEQIVVVR